MIVSRSRTVAKAKITVPLLISALFYDLTPGKKGDNFQPERAA